MEAIARGRHVSVIWACTKCHGKYLSGRLLTNDPIEGTIPTYGSIPAPNLTSGNGGIGRSYTETDWVRAIRHGVMPEGRGEFLMIDYSTMSDQDLGDLIAYLKQIPPVDANYPEMDYGPIVPVVSNLHRMSCQQHWQRGEQMERGGFYRHIQYRCFVRRKTIRSNAVIAHLPRDDRHGIKRVVALLYQWQSIRRRLKKRFTIRQPKCEW